ncbi:MAG TPA: hypothetical protein VEW73_01080 [Nocardioides sp.]|nr:hypothetical protein [Nocardioides sp.]
MTLPTLTAMVIGGLVGAGVFSLPARFGVATGILGSLIAWAIATPTPTRFCATQASR